MPDMTRRIIQFCDSKSRLRLMMGFDSRIRHTGRTGLGNDG